MASYTPNLNLKKPAYGENVDIADINNNMDVIDESFSTMSSNLEEVDKFAKANVGVSDEVKNFLGLDTSATVNDALLNLYVQAKGGAMVQVTVTSSAGNKIKNLIVHGLVSREGGECTTNDDGVAIGFTQTSVTTIYTDTYSDLSSCTVTVDTPLGGIYYVTLTPDETNFLKLLSSQQVVFSSSVSVSACLVGGGGGGGMTNGNSNADSAGGGGGGGYCVIVANSNIPKETTLNATIGSGGEALNTGGTAGSGGSTRLGDFTAAGGKGGSSGGTGGTGNGNGAYYTTSLRRAATKGTVVGYLDATENVVHGGGGRSGYQATDDGRTTPYAAGYVSNAYGKGGNGGYSSADTYDEYDGYITSWKIGYGGDGGDGAIMIRMVRL